MSLDLLHLSAQELSENFRTQKLKATEIVEYYLQRCEVLNPKINALIQINAKAMERAKELDLNRNKYDSSKKLAAVPILIKDMICTQGVATTAASKMLKDFVPPYNATLVDKLEHHGAIVIGKCNQDEFAMGSSSETSCFKPTKNPWSLEHVPGGSSGGSAAAVAASLAPISIGTDTGGSIRQPANFCGVFGLKPTYGRISRYGVVAFASSFDQAGPITRRVEDARTVLNVMIGKDNKDATSLPTKPVGEISGKQRLKIAKLKNFYETELDPQVAKRHEEVIQYLKSMGHEILEVSVDHLETSVECYYLLAMSEASSNLSRYDGIRFGYRSNFEKALPKNVEEFYIRNRTEGFGSEVKRRIAIGAYALSSGYFDAYFKQAAKVRRLIQNSFVSAFTKCDLIISPVTNEPAFKLGEKSTDPLKMYNNDAFTTCVNLAGLPAASVPIGWTQEKLPVGLQVIAAPFEEDKIFKVASQVENHMKTYEVWPHV